MATNNRHRIMTDETGQDIVAALNGIAAATKGSSIEYGVRFPVGASNPNGERVIRQNGVISAWDITFTRNINNSAVNCPFSAIDLFAPALWTDTAGNVFRRFKRFYYCEERIGNYDYVWVCRIKATPAYRLPKAFLPNWEYVDSAAFEGGTETINGTTVLCSKSGATLARSITRTVAYQRATAWNTLLGVNLNKERYMPLTMSEIVEIWEKLLYVQLASRNSDTGYLGHISNSYAEANLIMPGQTDTINGLHGTVANDGLHSFKMLGIENMWGNQWKHIADLTIKDYVPYVCDNMDNWTDTTTPESNAAFSRVGYTVATSNGYVKEMGFDPQHPDIVLPTVVGGSDSTYYADHYWIADGARTAFFGGTLYNGRSCGLSFFYLINVVGYSGWIIGARLSHRSL